jgi:hypothetical protein
MDHSSGGVMNERTVRWAAIFVDVQFWVPFMVLVIGLVLLWFVE